MTEQDLLITPIWFIILSVAAYLVRPYVTDKNTRRYFLPALWLRFVAAILLGVLYQFYYGGGDTFNFHTHGSSHIYDAFQDSIIKGINLLFASGEYIPGTYEYASKIWFYHDPSSYFIIKVSAFFDLLTFNTYSATALFFAAFSFSGTWALYNVFYIQYRKIHFQLAAVVLFLPSVVFWGSGILKDTLTLGALGWMVFTFFQIFINHKFRFRWIIIFLASAYVLYNVKIYILLTILPALMIWGLLSKISSIRSIMAKTLVAPIILVLGTAIIYYLVDEISASNPKYALANIAETARITAYDIGFYTGRDAGSGYALGELDGTIGSTLKLFPQAVNVTLFRPYLWEIKNPLMLLSAIESFIFLVLSGLALAYIFISGKMSILTKPLIIMTLLFSIVFAFAVGVSTFNFGTLARYKIPMLPFYAGALVIIYHLISEKALKKLRKWPEQKNFQ